MSSSLPSGRYGVEYFDLSPGRGPRKYSRRALCLAALHKRGERSLAGSLIAMLGHFLAQSPLLYMTKVGVTRVNSSAGADYADSRMTLA